VPGLRKVGRVWYSDVRIAGKRVRSPLSTDKQVAEEKLRELVLERDAARYGHAPKTSTWASFKAKYLAWSDGAKATTTARRDRAALSSLEKFRKPALLSAITPELLEQWKAARKTAGKGNATINRDINAVKAMMRRAVEWGYLKEWRGGAVKGLRETKGRLLFYSPKEVRRLLGVCRSRFSAFYDWETICLLGVRAGLRRSEIYYLSWQDVDLGKGPLGRRGLISIIPKDDWQPKSGEQRHIPIPPDLVTHLARLKRQGPWVIGDRPSVDVMSVSFRKILRRAKLPGSLHTLRHTYASHLAQAGVDILTISKLLGHATIEQSMVYSHLAPHNFSNAVLRLPRL
jgi:integrase